MRRVLIVDDNVANRQLIVEILRDQAICEEAQDGVEALEKYKKDPNKYGLMLLDIAMPKMDGIEVLKQIRASEASLKVSKADQLPVVLITGFPDRLPEGLEHGACDYLVKPVYPQLLVYKVEQFSRRIP